MASPSWATRAACSSGSWTRAEDMGYIWNAGPELEFFLFRKDADGKIKPAAA